MNWEGLLDTYGNWLATSGLRILLILFGTLIIAKVARVIIGRLFGAFKGAKIGEEMRKRTETLASLVRYVVSIGLYVLGLVMILDEFGIEIGPILAAAGIFGLAIGFGAQHLVQDVISGFFILMDDEIRVGDVIETAGKAGLVEKVNLRLVVLRDLQGRVHYIRNGAIDIVTNMTKEFAFASVDTGVAYRESYDEVTSIMREVDEQMRADEKYGELILEPLDILGLDEFADSAIVIKARIMTKPIKQWTVAREFRRRLKAAFDERGIEIPFPHATLYMGQDKDGSAPPLNVKLAGVTSPTESAIDTGSDHKSREE
jgi:small conductance mechanosensitive channel